MSTQNLELYKNNAKKENRLPGGGTSESHLHNALLKELKV